MPRCPGPPETPLCNSINIAGVVKTSTWSADALSIFTWHIREGAAEKFIRLEENCTTVSNVGRKHFNHATGLGREGAMGSIGQGDLY